MEPIVILLIVGAIGGVIRSLVGYEARAGDTENFDYAKAARSALRGAILGAFLVMGTASLTGSPITTQTYMMAFFVAVGADVLAKEGVTVVRA